MSSITREETFQHFYILPKFASVESRDNLTVSITNADDTLRNEDTALTTRRCVIDSMVLRVTIILTFDFGWALTKATRLFYLQDKFLYLVTSRHVVIDKTSRHYLDNLQVSLNNKTKRLTKN